MKRFVAPLLATLILSALHSPLSTLQAATQPRPKLVVEIVVDQLRTDYIEYLRPMFGTDGFDRLMRQGTYFRDVNFDVPGLDIASSTAIIATGANPAQAGVPSAQVFDRKTGKNVSALSDPSTLGNFTTETYSPANLLLSTVSDELAIDGAGLGAIFSIAADPQQAIILAGHAGNSAVWLNDNTGKWASTAWYGDMPQSASQRNMRTPLSSRLDTMQWKPLLKLDRYLGLPAQKRQYDFRYTFPSSDRDVYRKFAASPLGNREVTDLAIDYLNNMRLGNRGDIIDMLAIGLTAAPFKYVKDGDYRLELQDTYLRLDRDIARLLAAVDKAVGLNNALIFITSTGYYDDATPDDPKYRIPSGEFSEKRALSLLNSFLAAKYGNGDYISAFDNGQLYLNHRTLENARVSEAEATREARDFLCKMSGVRSALTQAEILAASTPEAERIRRRINPASAADIYVDIAPGWNLVCDRTYPPSVRPIRNSQVSTPALFMGTGIPARIENASIDATALAPTLTQALHLRAPNGAISRPLPL